MRMRGPLRGSAVVSLAVHGGALLLLLGVWSSRSALIAPMRLPGTAQGSRQMLVYSLGGSPPRAKTMLQAKVSPVDVALPRPRTKATPTLSPADNSSQGKGIAGDSALGDGNISIALVRFHPRPAPDLSVLPSGTAGDVVLDAVIDANGNISQLKLTKGLGGSIDQTVIATVQKWTFAPATKDGVPVASEQEILFHYERS